MKLNEIILKEESVLSSWISDLFLVSGSNGDITIVLGNGRRYSVKNVGNQIYQQWLKSPSKGQFWHKNIKDKYNVERLI